MLTRQQWDALLKVMAPYMALDRFGRTTICNLYYDTDSYRLIRRSLEKPAYKEKLRVRSYGTATETSPVFVELKKKYQDVVYKRRVSLPQDEAEAWMRGGEVKQPNQITAEIDYVRGYYEDLKPVVFLSYEREAFFMRGGGDFRVTFDENILCREEHLTLTEPAWGAPILPEGRVLMELKTSPWGTPLLPHGTVLMELKTPGGIPLWMTRFLTENHIYKTSFSKYGTAYRTLIFPELRNHKEGEKQYA